MDTVIKTERLSKSYLIGHQAPRRYVALRDVIVDGVKSIFSRKDDPAAKNEEFWALRDIGFEIKKNERVGIIGRNGAGKSTLLKVLSRITEPTQGRVCLKGRVASLLEVGTGFHPELTGRENIFLNGAILGMRKSEIERKFDEIVSFAEIEKFIDTPVKRYSSGMYVRLAFAVAAHLEPEILVVDEVLAVGDMVFQKKCLGKMENISKEGRTVLFVSHNMEAIQKLCTRAMILHEGKIIMDDETDKVVNTYLGEGMGLVAEKVWPDLRKAPGDEVVRLCGARVLNGEEKAFIKFDVRDPIAVEIEYQVLQEGHRLHTHFTFTNEMGHVVFSTKDNLDSPWKDVAYPAGRYRARCYIPGDFLNEGELSVYCAMTTVGLTNVGHVSEQNMLTFKVSDRMDVKGVRGNYPLSWKAGGVRPRLSWVVKKDR